MFIMCLNWRTKKALYYVLCIVWLFVLYKNRWNGNYTQYGELRVEKSDDGISIESSGALEVPPHDTRNGGQDACW